MTALSVIRGGADVEGVVPPNDLEAEAACLSAIMLDPKRLPSVDFLRPEHFYSESHRRIWEAILELRNAGAIETVDILTVSGRLKDSQRLAQVGGTQYLATILDAAPVVPNVVAYAERVYELARARAVVLAAQRIAAEGYAGVVDVAAYADRSAETLATIARDGLFRQPEGNLETIKRRLRELLEHQKTHGTRKMGLPLGLGRLDDVLAGLHAGQKVTIAALPGVGKTAALLNIARANAKAGIGSALFFHEGSREEILERLIAAEASVDGQKLRTGELTPGGWERVFACVEVVGRWPIAIFVDSSLHVGTIAAQAQRLADGDMLARYGAPLGLVGVDYVQRLEAPPELRNDATKYQVVSHSTKALTKLAERLKLPVVELAQEKAQPIDRVKGTRPAPDIGDTSDSKEIGKEAHVLVFIRRKPIIRNGKPTGQESQRDVKFVVRKQRGGPEDEVDLEFEAAFQRFGEPKARAPEDGGGGYR